MGLKIRANPTNRSALTDVAIIVAVPPNVSGESARMSRQGGAWDGMKRLVAWSVDEIDPGQMLELQVQFRFMAGSEEETGPTPMFPILVRCTAIDELFSGVTFSASDANDMSAPLRMHVSRSSRILHRKV